MREAGFTLLELLVVLAILGLLTALVAMRGPSVSHGLAVRSAAAEMTAALRETRQHAIAANRPAEFTLDLAHRTFRGGDHPTVQLPSDLGITILTTTGEVRSAKVVGIRFDPDGSSTGGRIELATETRHIRIGVDWLSGKVSVSSAK